MYKVWGGGRWQRVEEGRADRERGMLSSRRKSMVLEETERVIDEVSLLRTVRTENKMMIRVFIC